MINFTCGTCGANMNIGDELAGKAVRCPYCQATLRLPRKRTPKRVIIARFFTWPVICLSIPALLLGWPVFLGGMVAVGLGLLFCWAFTNIGGAIWCKMNGTSHYLKLWKHGGGDPFFDTLDSPFNNDPPSVRFQELYREKLRQETEADQSASPPARDIPSINDPNIIL